MSRVYPREAWAALKHGMSKGYAEKKAQRWEEKGVRSKAAIGTPWRGSKAELQAFLLEQFTDGVSKGLDDVDLSGWGEDEDEDFWKGFRSSYSRKRLALAGLNEEMLKQATLEVFYEKRRLALEAEGDDESLATEDDEGITGKSTGTLDSAHEWESVDGDQSCPPLAEPTTEEESLEMEGLAEVVEQVTRRSTGLSQLGDQSIEPAHANEESNYVYSSLGTSDGRTRFRLLEINPGGEDDVMTLTLSEYYLDDCPEYEALSYCWGEVTEELPISVNGANLGIRRTLGNALLRLRLEDQPRVLWADAICINQKDDDERAEQVSLMRDIYQRAERTIVDIGPRTDETAANAFKMLRAIANEAESKLSRSHTQESGVDYHNLTGTYADLTHSSLGTDADGKAYETSAVRELVLTDWFSRVWVVQEVSLARDAIVIWGTEIIDWQTLQTGISVGLKLDLFQTKWLGLTNEIAFRRFEALAKVDTTPRDKHPVEHLRRLMMNFRDRRATDPRDKVFALLGLVEGSLADVGVIPNYRLSDAEVYTQVAKAILENTTDLSLLSCCAARATSDLGLQLPSWVPDWSNRTGVALPFDEGIVGRYCNSQACGSTTAFCRFRDESGSALLALEGYQIDSIAELASPLPALISTSVNEMDGIEEEAGYSTEYPSDFHEWKYLDKVKYISTNLKGMFGALNDLLRRPVMYLSTLIEWETLARIKDKNVVSPTGETNRSVYLQTLIAGCLPTSLSAIEEEFKEWLDSLSPIRRMVRFGIDKKHEGLFVPLALAGYMRKTWNQYSAFNTLLEHASLRRLARTKNGSLALVPSNAEVGDLIGLFKGSRWPAVYRPHNQGDWEMVGQSYVHGVMLGESFQEDACEALWFR